MNRFILIFFGLQLAIQGQAQCTLLIEASNPGSGCVSTSEELLFSSLSDASFASQTITKTSSSNSWNSGAFGLNKVFENGSAYTVVSTNNAQRAFGLSASSAGTNPSDIDYAFRLRPTGVIQIFESGNNQANVGSYSSGDTLRIKNDSGTIKYFRNSELLYESTVAPPAELYMDVALRTPGSSLTGLNVENVSDGSFEAINFYNLGFFAFYTWTLNGTVVGTNSAQLSITDFEDGDVLTCNLFNLGFSCFGTTTSNSISLVKPSSQPFSFYIEGLYSAGSASMAAEEVVWREETLQNVEANGNDLLKTQNAGWNGNASSYNTVKEGGYFEFTASETNERRMAGLSNSDANESFETIAYAIYLLQNGTVRIYESGVNQGLFGAYSTGSVFRIEVDGGLVNYYMDGTLLRSTALNGTLPLLADVSIRDVGGTISNALVVNRNNGSFTATATGAGSQPDFQWMQNGAIVGANAPSFTTSGLAVNDEITVALGFDFEHCDPAPVVSNVVRYLGAENTTNWIGVVDTDWNRIANWSNGIPAETISAVIPSGTPNDPLVNTSAVVKNLEIRAGAQLGFVAANSLRVCGDLENRGSFNAGGGTVSFSSTGVKKVSGDPITFNRLIASTSSVDDSIILETDIQVSDETVFIRGIIYTAANEVVYLNGAGSREGMPFSHIDGTCRKIGNSPFRFPTGNSGTYAPITISAPAQPTDVFTARYFQENPGLAGYPHSAQDGNAATISQCEYWILDRENGSSVVSVTLSFEDNRSCEVNEPSELLVMRWDGSEWQSHGYLTHTGDQSEGTVTSGLPILNFSPFTLGSGSSINPLPIELAYFNASARDELVVLEWATFSELNNAFFTLERSRDGMNFNPVGEVVGQGNASVMNAYSFIDDAPLEGGSYYRLVQTDFDGAKEVFPMEYVFIDRSTNYHVFPNPSNGLLMIDFAGLSATRSIKISNTEGRTVYETYSDRESEHLDLRSFAPGLYIIQVSDGSGIEYIKHIIE